MNIYTTDKIRNVVLLGHGGAGKTSLVESMAYLSGITSRMGKVEDGNTVSDYGKEEQKRRISISTSVVPIEWDGVKINVLDTPGYFDFIGEVEEAISAADAAVIVVSGKSGVEAGTEKAWELCEKYKLPRMIYVTGMDADNASFKNVVEKLTVCECCERDRKPLEGQGCRGMRNPRLQHGQSEPVQRYFDGGGSRNKRGVYGPVFWR